MPPLLMSMLPNCIDVPQNEQLGAAEAWPHRPSIIVNAASQRQSRFNDMYFIVVSLPKRQLRPPGE
jgi:hypothetical protein